MELPELLTKFKELEDKKEKLKKELYELNNEISELYTTAWNDGFVWDFTEKKWYKE
jgi:chaperonin cofactor prefoldin